MVKYSSQKIIYNVLIYIFVYLVLQILLSTVLIVALNLDIITVSQSEEFVVISSVSMLIASLICATLYLFVNKETLINDAKSFIKDKKFLYGLVGYVVLFLFSIAITLIYKYLDIGGNSANQEFIEKLVAIAPLMMFVSIVILIPFIEEIFFRGVIVEILEKCKISNKFLLIVLSSILFAFVHVTDIESFKYFFLYFAMALPLGGAYILSGKNIWVVVMMHMLNNAMMFLPTILY